MVVECPVFDRQENFVWKNYLLSFYYDILHYRLLSRIENLNNIALPPKLVFPQEPINKNHFDWLRVRRLVLRFYQGFFYGGVN